jgi:hypothetical protein
MSQVAPTEVLRLIIGIVAREGWRDNPSAVSELECLVLGDPLDAQFEFYGVPAAATVAQEVVVGEVSETDSRDAVASLSSNCRARSAGKLET